MVPARFDIARAERNSTTHFIPELFDPGRLPVFWPEVQKNPKTAARIEGERGIGAIKVENTEKPDPEAGERCDGRALVVSLGCCY